MRLPSNYRRQYFKNTASRNLSFDKTSKTQFSLEASFELQSKLSFRLRLPSNYSPSKTHRHNFSLLFSFFPLLFSLLSFLRLCSIVLLICPSECCTSSNSALYDLQAPYLSFGVLHFFKLSSVRLTGTVRCHMRI